ncbi:hypothetical protein LB572_17855 [Mesorhizobium sp. BH1-1-5]|uniref:hypothetical protein n=1 Tax=Mesorhizobium sp. BH1-1-5 TaxID=2876661 RepID=UPI001CCCC47C|nr:hypothetical protein [Mesorhizobium sp. BH1-1-5]MBZ9988963.1 hypothetical protein [Mesorhizobium sp. BH1-1-5]
MRFCISVTALGFLLVAIAAGMWPSWALAWSLSRPTIAVAVQSSPDTTQPSAFKPCYHTVRTSSISCFPQIGLPEGATGGETRNSGHCIPAISPHATKLIFRETEPRPPRPSFVA